MSEEIPFGIPQLSLWHPAHPLIAQVGLGAGGECQKSGTLVPYIRLAPSGNPVRRPPRLAVGPPTETRGLRPAPARPRPAPLRPPSGTWPPPSGARPPSVGHPFGCPSALLAHSVIPSGHSVRLSRPATPLTPKGLRVFLLKIASKQPLLKASRIMQN
jgi:hypothetical protein